MDNSIEDLDIRNEILEEPPSSTVVSASAGSGKTTIMIEKIKRVLDIEETHRTIAAITFTIKATKEIKDRLQNNVSHKDIVVSTNDSFIENEIIRPFLIDSGLLKVSECDFVVKYNSDLNSFDEGLAKLNNEKTLSSYHRDLKKNFKFELAKMILTKSLAARQYIKAKYFMMFIDEYQDSDTEMHELFMYIKEKLNIDLFIVGDEKQAIYIWRGARRNIFNDLDSHNFKKYVLTHNFRCHPQITNFANLIHHPEYFIELPDVVTNIVLCKTTLSKVDCIKRLFLSGELDINKETTVLINVNASAAEFCKVAKEEGYDFVFIPKSPIDDLANGFIFKQMATLYFEPLFSIYDFCEALRIDNEDIAVSEYEEILLPLISGKEVDLQDLEKMSQELGKLLNINFESAELQSLLVTLSTPTYDICFKRNNSKLKAMTVFGSKGLEFNQVVAFAGDYNLKNEESKNKHYVAITRAENKMIMVDNTLRYEKELKSFIKEENVYNGYKLEKIIKLIDL
jgi:ATP-dependent exoDNAse (exonuclease V) beta subunit